MKKDMDLARRIKGESFVSSSNRVEQNEQEKFMQLPNGMAERKAVQHVRLQVQSYTEKTREQAN